MNAQTWLRRLRRQLPGWFVWTSQAHTVWHAVPTPGGECIDNFWLLPGQVEAATPNELRRLAQERYGWDDYCESCGVLARECGHRQPEREKTLP